MKFNTTASSAPVRGSLASCWLQGGTGSRTRILGHLAPILHQSRFKGLFSLLHWLILIYLVLVTSGLLHLWKREEVFRETGLRLATLRHLLQCLLFYLIIFPLLLCGSADICGYCCYSLRHMGTKSMCISILWAWEIKTSGGWESAPKK